jgi:uncharacterized protein YukE
MNEEREQQIDSAIEFLKPLQFDEYWNKNGGENYDPEMDAWNAAVEECAKLFDARHDGGVTTTFAFANNEAAASVIRRLKALA